MAEANRELEQLSPDDLVADFGRTGLVKWIVLAVVIHVVLLGATSVGYVHLRFLEWFDPQAYEAKIAAIEAEQKARIAAAQPAPAPARSVPPAPSPDGTAADGAPATGTPAVPDRENNAYVEQLRQTATPAEIPQRPDDLGLSIEDTRPR